MRPCVAFAVLSLAVQALALDLSSAVMWSIPEGEVSRVEVDGATVWPCIPYATNGLIAYWDAVWNAGLGVHDSATSTWIDLSTNHFDATQRVATGWSWTNDAYVAEGANWQGFLVPSGFTALFDAARGGHTIEIISSMSATRRMTIFGAYAYYSVNFEYFPLNGQPSFRWYYNSTPSQTFTVPTPTNRQSFAVVSSSTGTYGYMNGALMAQNTTNAYVSTNRGSFVIGGEPARNTMSMAGEICAIRVYDRPLSQAEIAHNVAIDAVRFGIVFEAPSAAMLSASSPRTLSSSAPLALDAAPATLEDLAPDDFTDDDPTDPYALPDAIDHQEESSNLEFEDFAAFDDPADESEAAPEPEESR